MRQDGKNSKTHSLRWSKSKASSSITFQANDGRKNIGFYLTLKCGRLMPTEGIETYNRMVDIRTILKHRNYNHILSSENMNESEFIRWSSEILLKSKSICQGTKNRLQKNRFCVRTYLHFAYAYEHFLNWQRQNHFFFAGFFVEELVSSNMNLHLRLH